MRFSRLLADSWSSARNLLARGEFRDTSLLAHHRQGRDGRTGAAPGRTPGSLTYSRQTAVDDAEPQISPEVVKAAFDKAGVARGKLRQDRIFDEARETADPVRLMHVFGLCSVTATRYVVAAHPDRMVDPIQPSTTRS
ncbi:hypothetical protein [Streptomyces sp. NBC_01445]|uniref:hypothetical protein n=1 Tax=Streptomyces sp. NBC_01445 TaxID=2903869 RepID=UPI002DD7AE18|nr:hypothetical protein [Streptomyces sp. NBC_01445]WSE02257.1 hypothetical protein OG574_01830 [Streptomyces sp. NBC_01445]